MNNSLSGDKFQYYHSMFSFAMSVDFRDFGFYKHE